MTQTTAADKTTVRTVGEVTTIHMDGTLGEPDQNVLMTRENAEKLLRQLADSLGVTAIFEGQRQDLGLLVRETIAAADERDAQIGTPTLADLNAHRDAMRDLRDVLRRADVISG